MARKIEIEFPADTRVKTKKALYYFWRDKSKQFTVKTKYWYWSDLKHDVNNLSNRETYHKDSASI